MNLRDLKSIAKAGEGQYVEFKKNANRPDQITEEVVGFANSTGGDIYIGIDDNGLLSGVKFPDDDVNFFQDYLQHKINPSPQYKIEIIPLSKNKSIIRINVRSGINKPYARATSSERNKKVLYRVNDQCLQASRELKSILRGMRLGNNQVIRYSDLENEILKLVDKRTKISKQELVQESGFTSRKISDCLIRLVLAGVLKIIPTADHDLYEFNQQI